jgi:subtilase family serine protease
VKRVVNEVTRTARLKASRIPLSVGALCALLAVSWFSPQPSTAQGGQSSTVSPLPAYDYSVHSVCSFPTPGRAGCLALELVPETPAARAHTHPLGITLTSPVGASGAAEACHPPVASEGCYGLRPQDLHSAYALPVTAQSAQTIGIVDAYNDPTAQKDLKIYDEEFHLPACTIGNGCITRLNQEGKRKPLPPTDGGWALEIALDIEIAHATCQNCHIVLVEANSSSLADLEVAESRAIKAGATEISNSWSGAEPPSDSATFSNPGIVITAAVSDYGYDSWGAPTAEEKGLVDYPASSPHVIAVGGTRLTLSAPSNTWKSESVWNGFGATGGGCSRQFTAPPWQLELADWSVVGCAPMRAAVDIAADGDPYTGVAVYDSTADAQGKVRHWTTIGGTSLASPLIAATFALAGGGRGVEYPARSLYENEVKAPASLHDIESGSNGECAAGPNPEGIARCTTLEEGASCSGTAICVAGPGYDGPSGVGTPNGIGAFEPTGASVKGTQLIEFTSTAPTAAGVGGPTYAVAAQASSGLAVSFSSGTPPVCSLTGSVVNFITVGTCRVDAHQSGNSQYYPAPEVHQSMTVGKGSQVITFTSTAPISATVGGPTYAVAAHASSGLAVSFSSGAPSVCSLTGSTVNFIAAGTCTIDANQAGNSEYGPAPEARQSFTVVPRATGTSTLPAASSATLSFASSFTPLLTPVSAFSLLGKPGIDHMTGAITIRASVANAGTFSWLLAFQNGRYGVFQASNARCRKDQIKLGGKCRPANVVLAQGGVVVGAAGVVSFTARPSASAMKALKAARARGQGVVIKATLRFQSALGGSPVSHTRSLTDMLEKIGKQR